MPTAIDFVPDDQASPAIDFQPDEAPSSAPPVENRFLTRDAFTGQPRAPINIPTEEEMQTPWAQRQLAAENRFQQQTSDIARLRATPVEDRSTTEKTAFAALAGPARWAAEQVGAVKELADIGPARDTFAAHEKAMLRAGQNVDYPEIDLKTGLPKGPSPEGQAAADVTAEHERLRAAIKAPYAQLEKPMAETAGTFEQAKQNVPGNETVANIAESVTGMLPYVAEAMIPVVGQTTAVVSGGLGGYKSTLDQALEKYTERGIPELKARKLAQMDATRAGLVSAELFAALPGAGKSAAERLIADRIEKANPLVKAAVNTLSASTQGGVVMGTMTLVDQAMAKWTYNPDLTWDQALESAAKSALTSAAAVGIMHTPMEAANLLKAPPENIADANLPATWTPNQKPDYAAAIIQPNERTQNAVNPVNDEIRNVPRIETRQDIQPNAPEVRQAPSDQANGGNRTEPAAQGPTEVPGLAGSRADNDTGRTGAVQSRVLSPSDYLKILDPIIVTLPVKMVNDFGGREATANVLLHNPTMLKAHLASHFPGDILPLASRIEGVVASTRAKLSGGDTTGGNVEFLAALETLHSDLGKMGRLPSSALGDRGAKALGGSVKLAPFGTELSNVSAIGENVEGLSTVLTSESNHGEKIPLQTGEGNSIIKKTEPAPPAAPAETTDQTNARKVRERVAAGIEPSHINISVTPAQTHENGQVIPAQIQIDERHPTLGNTFSVGPEAANENGLKVPSRDELAKLPLGQYTLPDAIAKLKELGKVKAEPAGKKEPWQQTREQFVGPYEEPYSVKDIQDASKRATGARSRFQRKTGPMVPPAISGEISGKISKQEATAQEMRDDYRKYVDDYKAKAEQHYEAVKQALKKGKEVPAEVLADYPELKPKPAPPSAPAKPASVSEIDTSHFSPKEKKAYDQAVSAISTIKDYAPKERGNGSRARRKSIERADIYMRRAAEILGIKIPSRTAMYHPESDLKNAQFLESEMAALFKKPLVEPVKPPSIPPAAAAWGSTIGTSTTSGHERGGFDTKQAKAQKKYLLTEIDKAIEEAPDTPSGEFKNGELKFDHARTETAYDGQPTSYGKTTEEHAAEKSAWEAQQTAKFDDLFSKYGIPADAPASTPYLNVLGETEVHQKGGPIDFSGRIGLLREAITKANHALLPKVTIDVPGDGTFEAENTKSALTKLREGAENFPTNAPKSKKPSTAREGQSNPAPLGNGGAEEISAILKDHVGDDATRKVLNYAFSDGKQTVATDGRRLVVVSKGSGGTEKKPVAITTEGKPVKEKDLKIPNWKQVIPHENDRKTFFRGLDTARLFMVLRQAKEATSEKSISVKIYKNPDGSLGTASSTPGETSYAHNIQEGAEVLGALDPQFLIDAVNAARRMGNEKVDILGKDELSPFIIKAKNVETVIMPVRLMGEAPEVTTRKASDVPESKTDERSVRDVWLEQYDRQLGKVDAGPSLTGMSGAVEVVRTAEMLGLDKGKVIKDLMARNMTQENADYALRNYKPKTEPPRELSPGGFKGSGGVGTGIEQAGNEGKNEQPNKTQGYDPQKVELDLRRSGKVLWGTGDEISRAHLASHGHVLPSTASEGVGPDRGRESHLGTEAAGAPIPARPRIYIETLPENQRLLVVRNANLLAHRILFGTDNLETGFLETARFIKKLSDKLPGIPIAFIDHPSRYKALYSSELDAIVVNTRFLDRNIDVGTYDTILSEELIHAVDYHINSKSERESVWNSLSPEEQARTREAYNPSGDNPNLTPEQLGSEYLRLVVQDRLLGRVSEETEKDKSFTQQAKGALQRFLDFLRETFGKKPANNIARQIVERIEGAIRGDPIPDKPIDWGGESVGSGIEKAGDEESRIRDVQYVSGQYKGIDEGNDYRRTPMSDARAQDYLSKTLFLPGQPDTSAPRWNGSQNSNLVFKVQPDGFNHDDAGRQLLEHLKEQVSAQNHPGGDPAYTSSLENAVSKNLAIGNFDGVFSLPMRIELQNLTASQRSQIGKMLRAKEGLPDDLQSVGRDVLLHLQPVWANAFGGTAIDSAFKRILVQFRNFFSEGDHAEIRKILDGTEPGKKLTAFFDQMKALQNSESGGRLYRLLQGAYKPKRPFTTGKLEADAYLKEEAAAVMEQMAKLGLAPTERPGKKALTPLEALRHMVRDEGIQKVEAHVNAAISEGEKNAALDAMIKAEGKEPDPAKKRALQDDIALIQSGDLTPDKLYIEQGLNDPKFAHWRTIRDNWTGYSPTSMKLVENLIKRDFKGTKFETKERPPPEPKIDLAALAKSPEAEVQRILDEHLNNVRAQIDIDGASPESRARVVNMIQDEVANQLALTKDRLNEPMFAVPKDPKAKMTPEQVMAQKLNQGLFKDPRADLPGMVERLAGKSAVTKLLPNITDIIKQIFDTPFYHQNELAQRFADKLAKELGIDDAQRDKAKEVFKTAFDEKQRAATARALEQTKASLTPAERKEFAKRSLFQKLERFAKAGGMEGGKLMREIAAERGWKPPSDATVDTMKKLAIREEELRTLNPRELAVLEAKGASPQQIEEARSKKEAAFDYERAAIMKRMAGMWADMTKPLPGFGPFGADLIRHPGKSGKQWYEHRRNYAAAVNELNTFNLLAKVGFTAFRLPVHLTTQLLGHAVTRPIARAMELRRADLAAGNHTMFLKDVAGAMQDSAKATLAALRPALVAARAEMLGRGQHRNVDRLLTGINALDRLYEKANTYWKNGDYTRSVIAHLFAWPRVMSWYISAVDRWQGTPVEYADIVHRIEMSMREMGRSQAEIKTFKDEIFGMMKTEITGATIEAQQWFQSEGIDASEKKIKEAAYRIVRRNIYNAIERAGLPADDFEAENKIVADTQSWQTETKGGLGMIVAAPLRFASGAAESVGLPFSYGRFTNAIATGINYSLMWTPFYKLANVRWPAGTRSTWFGTDFDRSQRLAMAALGTTMGAAALALMQTGALVMTPPWIPDKNERDKFEREGHKLNTAEFMLPGGKFIPVSVLVGPMTLMAPYLYFGGAMQRLMDGRTKAQAKLNAEAEKKGLPAGKIRPISTLEVLGVALETAWGAMLGNHTVSGLASSVTENASLNANKIASSYILSPSIPGVPGYQEISRAEGIAMDKNLATVWDYLIPLPTSKARAVNMLGDPVGTPDDIQRWVQTMTSGTFPWPVDPKAANKESAYAVLSETGFRPPAISPNKGYLINGEFRPMNDTELSKFTVLRGQLLKQALSGMQGASLKEVKSAFNQVNVEALSEVGAENVKVIGSGGGSAQSPIASTPHGTSGSRAGSMSGASGGTASTSPKSSGGAGSPRTPSGYRGKLSLGGSRSSGGLSLRAPSRSASRSRRLVFGRLRVRSGGTRRRLSYRSPGRRRSRLRIHA